MMSNLVRYVDVCIANEEDADKVLGIKAPNNNVESGKLNKSSYEYVAKEICERFGCKKVAITLRESINASRNGWSGMLYAQQALQIILLIMILILWIEWVVAIALPVHDLQFDHG